MSQLKTTSRQPSGRLQVLLLTEGTYPYHFGGVSTWCHMLLRQLPEVDFTLMSIISDPRLPALYELSTNVVALRPVALWGVLDAVEAQTGMDVAELQRRRRRTTAKIIAYRFVPLLHLLLQEILMADDEPERLGASIHAIHRFALEYDLDTALRSRCAWDAFAATVSDCFPHIAAHHGYPGAELRLSDLTSGMQWLHHLLFPIAQPLPRVDVAHAAMSGLCAVVALCAKFEHSAGFLLTEHGIYIRECYLAEAGFSASLFLKILRLRFALRVAADVCHGRPDLAMLRLQQKLGVAARSERRPTRNNLLRHGCHHFLTRRAFVQWGQRCTADCRLGWPDQPPQGPANPGRVCRRGSPRAP
jgi:hypothetical protein